MASSHTASTSITMPTKPPTTTTASDLADSRVIPAQGRGSEQVASNVPSTWKYAMIAIVMALVVLALFSRYLRKRFHVRKAATGLVTEEDMIERPARNITLRDNFHFLSPYHRTRRIGRNRTTTNGPMSTTEFHARRRHSVQVHQALLQAGLILPDPAYLPSGRFSFAEGEVLMRRDGSREERRRQRNSREGAGLPKYTEEVTEGERLLQVGTKTERTQQI